MKGHHRRLTIAQQIRLDKMAGFDKFGEWVEGQEPDSKVMGWEPMAGSNYAIIIRRESGTLVRMVPNGRLNPIRKVA